MTTIPERIEQLQNILLKDGFVKEKEETGITTAELYVKQLIPIEQADVNQITCIAILMFSNGNVIYQFGIKKLDDGIFEALAKDEDVNPNNMTSEDFLPVFTGWIQPIDIMENVYTACFQKILSGEETSLRDYIERSITVITDEHKKELDQMDKTPVGECIRVIKQQIEEYKQHAYETIMRQQDNTESVEENTSSDEHGNILQFPGSNILQ